MSSNLNPSQLTQPLTPYTSINSSQSYSNVTSQSFPTKECAIVLDSIEGVPVREYTYALARKIDPKLIRSASKISQQRVCFYLTTKEIARQLTQEENNKLTVSSSIL